MNDEVSPIAQIERQLSKMESTARNLETVSVLAARANRTQEAKTLSDQAVDLRVKQFVLYRNKDRLQVNSKEWKALVSALELVNHRRGDCRSKSHKRGAGRNCPLDLSCDKTCRSDCRLR